MAERPQPDDNSVVNDHEVAERKPYRTPKLRRLGSVRELTLGSRNGKAEGAGLKMA